MATVNLTIPDIRMEDLGDDVRLQKIVSYLHQLNEQLRYQLSHIDDENITGEGLSGEAFSKSARESINLELTKQVSETAASIAIVRAYADQVYIELADKASMKDVQDAIGGIDEFHNTSVTIMSDGAVFRTTGTIRFVVDDFERMVIDETGVNARLIVADELRAKNVVTKNLTAVIAWKGSIQASLDAAEKYLTAAETVLSIPAGTYSEDVEIQGFKGGRLRLHALDGVVISGYVHVQDCDNVTISGEALGAMKMYPISSMDALTCEGVGMLQLKNLQVSGYRYRTTEAQSSEYGIVLRACRFTVENCSVEYTRRAIGVLHGSSGMVKNCSGGVKDSNVLYNGNLQYGLYVAEGSHVGMQGTIPVGVTSNAYETYATIKTTDASSGGDSGSEGSMEYTEPEQVTKSFKITRHCTYQYGEKRITDESSTQFVQGKYGAYTEGMNGWNIGAMWFNGATSELAGKTIKSAYLTLRRAAGGGDEVPLYMGTVSLTEDTYEITTSPTFAHYDALYPAGSLTRNTEGTYDVTGLIGAVKEGYAIAVKEPRAEYSDNWSAAYTQFFGKGSAYEPVLTVTYM